MFYNPPKFKEQNIFLSLLLQGQIKLYKILNEQLLCKDIISVHGTAAARASVTQENVILPNQIPCAIRVEKALVQKGLWADVRLNE